MDNNINKFRKATFGGFNRKDVIDYIEKIQNEFYDYKKETEKTVEKLNEKISQLEALSCSCETTECVAEESKQETALLSEENGSASEINMATAKLRNVTDELCRSLNDFMDKLTENSISVMFDIPCEACEQQECEEEIAVTDEECPAELDRVQNILGRVACAFVQESNVNEIKAQETSDSKRRNSVTDILNSASFVC